MSDKSSHINRVLRRAFICTANLFLSHASFAQVNNEFVKNFKAEAIEGKVYMSWTTRAGFTCQDIHIEISEDSISNYTRTGTYYGVCGDTSEKNYTYVILNPTPNKLNYIKLALGNYGYSNVISILVIDVKEDVFIMPHPVTSNSTIYFENVRNETLYFNFYNTTGVLLHSIITRDNKIELRNTNLPRGLIISRINAEGIIRYTSKFIVQSAL